MRKLFFVCCLSVVFAFTMISCATVATPQVNATTMNIPNPDISLSLSTGDFTVLGRVTGSGSISYNSRTGVYTGDTLKYGSLGVLGSIGHISNVTTSSGLWGLNTTSQSVVNTPTNSREMAIGNATYSLIEKAKELGADALIFVTTTVEATANAASNTSTSNVTISGIAIKLK